MTNTRTRNGANATPVLLAVAAALMVGSLTSQMATAASSDDVPTVVVPYDARSLQSTEGAQALYRRLETAARQVCPDDSMRDPARAAAGRQCRRESLARAVHAINNPRLAKLLGDGASRG